MRQLKLCVSATSAHHAHNVSKCEDPALSCLHGFHAYFRAIAWASLARQSRIDIIQCRCGDSCAPGIGVPAAAASGMITANTLVPVRKHLQLLDSLVL